MVAVGAQRAHEIGEQREGVVERLQIGDLAADVHVDAGDAQALQLAGVRIDLARAADRNAELVLRLAGRDLGVGPGIDVRIDAHRDARGAPFRGRDAREQFQLGLGLHVDAQNAGVDRRGEFVCGLADAGEHDLLRRHTRRERALQFTARDHVGAGAKTRERRDHRLVGVRLHGVADERGHIRERIGEHAVVPLQRRGGIAVERRADALGESAKINRLGVHHAGPIGEMVHDGPGA